MINKYQRHHYQQAIQFPEYKIKRFKEKDKQEY
jgi:hypothetical protein